MNVLVTGGAGYIGSVMVRMLLEEGYRVSVLDRFIFGRESLKDVEDMIKIIESDTRKVSRADLDGIEAIVDMAALSNDPSGELDPENTMEINYGARKNIAEMSKKAGVKKYVLASSCSVYGFQEGILNETSETNPLTTYAKANVLWEQSTLPLGDRNFSVTALRQATCYGMSCRMRFDLAINGMVLGFFRNGKIPIMRDGNQWRPFVHVKDTSRAFMSVIESDEDVVNGHVFNVGSNDQNCQIIKLAELIADSIGMDFNYEWYGSADKRSYRVSFDKISDVLKFRTRHTPKTGAKEIYDALRNGSLDPDDPRSITVNWYKELAKSGKGFL